MKRTPLRRVGARSNRERPSVDEFRARLRKRSDGFCEACGRLAVRGDPLDPHHIVPKGRARGWPDLNNPDVNGLAVCRYQCHEILTLAPRKPPGWMHTRARERIADAFRAFERWRSGQK